MRVYGEAVGAQLEMPVVVSLSLGRLFHLEGGAHDDHDDAGAADDHDDHGDGHGGGDVADAIVGGIAAPLVPVAGKWTVFDFWATWCEACVVLDDELRALAARRPEVAIRRVDVVDLDSPIATQELRGVTTLPHVRLVDPRGRTVYEASGTPDELLRALADHLP